MSGIPRVITVDPNRAVPRIVRAALDLSERSAVQVDLPGGLEALEEIQHGGYRLVVSALQIDRHMKGFELALRVRQISPETAVIILADPDDLEDLDEETRAESPFVYLRRPVDPQQFMRVLTAALDGEDVLAAVSARPASRQAPPRSLPAWDFGPVPLLDLHAADAIIGTLLSDVGALAAVLSTRTGDVLLDRGAASYLERGQLAAALQPLVQTTLAMSETVGGPPSVLQFFDGDTYDLFVLSLGFHHFLTLAFDGHTGSRQFGAVTRFGRRAAEDLKALLGASAYIIEAAKPAPEPVLETGPEIAPVEEPQDEDVVIEPAEPWGDDEATAPTAEIPEVEAMQLEPIDAFDPAILDGLQDLQGYDEQAVDDLFNLEKVAQIASESRRGRGPLSYDEARELGIVP